MTIDSYPLCWPHGRKRTGKWYQEGAKFDTSFARARDSIIREVALLKDTHVKWLREGDVIISTNIALRRDGYPLANQRQPEDTGVAVYFTYNGKQQCFACDRWKKIEDNMQAIAKTIEALRGISRWGTGDMLAAAFTGFVALPAPDAKRGWREVLGADLGDDLATVRAKYRDLASRYHPDRNAHADAPKRMAEINRAWDEAQMELGT